MGKDLISGNSMSWRLGNSIRSKQVYNFGELNDGEDIIRDRENIKENIQTSVKDGLVLYELKQLNNGWWRMFRFFGSKEAG